MKFLQVALLGIIAGTAQASPASIDIPAGSQVECLPFPNLDAIKNIVAIKEGYAQGIDPAQQIVTCTVIPNQVVPAMSVFVGELKEVSAHRYAVVWHRLRMPGADGGLSWQPSEKDLVAIELAGSGNLRIDFNRGLKFSESAPAN